MLIPKDTSPYITSALIGAGAALVMIAINFVLSFKKAGEGE